MVSDLMVIAFVRRVLLELGAELQPDAHHDPSVGPLEVWIHQPHVGLGGKTPYTVLQEQGGSLRVRGMLSTLVADLRKTANGPSLSAE